MGDSNTKISSITKEFSFVEEMSLSVRDPDIKELIDFAPTVHLTENKIVSTTNGHKILIKGYKSIKIRYLSKMYTKVEIKSFIFPFFELIEIPPCSKINNLSSKFIYTSIEKCDDRLFWFFNVLSITILLSIVYLDPIISTFSSEDTTDSYQYFNDNSNYTFDSTTSNNSYESHNSKVPSDKIPPTSNYTSKRNYR